MTIQHTSKAVHQFHIPVMGTGFTIDTPLRVAKYGIDSVISLVDDELIEMTRRYHAEIRQQSTIKIDKREPDARARRITAYLNWLGEEIENDFSELRKASFLPGSPLLRYFELLPNGPLRDRYRRLTKIATAEERRKEEEGLRNEMVCGSIDVNIMTKLNRTLGVRGEVLDSCEGDAFSALRGFAKSELRSSIIFSAGFSPQLLDYMTEFDDFRINAKGQAKKQVILKVSDFRSALVQGKFLAKKGIWVSEYRIESGLNCGGHAFPTKGLLLGPILEKFLEQRENIRQECFRLLVSALRDKNRETPEQVPTLNISAQGGVGTADEHWALINRFEVDRVGWGTPFLMVPEVTRVDSSTRERLRMSERHQVWLSNSSPLGIPFWNLKNSSSEKARRIRVFKNRPGSSCPLGFAATEKSKAGIPWCKASRSYQASALAELDKLSISDQQRQQARGEILAKSCICFDLGGGARDLMNIGNSESSAICPGPNIENFRRVMSLEEMVGHIYGRTKMVTSSDRCNMFIRELEIYAEFLEKSLSPGSMESKFIPSGSIQITTANIRDGIAFYRRNIREIVRVEEREDALAALNRLSRRNEEILERICISEKQGSLRLHSVVSQ